MVKEWQLKPSQAKELLDHLLALRGVATGEKATFLNPPYPLKQEIAELAGIAPQRLAQAAALIITATQNNRPIVIHGDYDADGITATAILWEVIYRAFNYQRVFPYLPKRLSEGYGLSAQSLEAISHQYPGALVVTVDCGITALAASQYATKLGLELIITDHHAALMESPKSLVTLHSTALTGSALAWLLAEELLAQWGVGEREGLLELAALGVIADIQPLRGANRQLVSHGLSALQRTTRPGLRALLAVAGVAEKELTPGVVGWWLTPRINAAGRLDDAYLALRLLCTESPAQAEKYAVELNKMNALRQELTTKSWQEALTLVNEDQLVQVLASSAWHEGIIGLIAGKIREELNKPTVVIATSGKVGKGSARSIAGFDITAALRSLASLLPEVGGHPQAAGFSICTKDIEALREGLNDYAAVRITKTMLTPVLELDAALPLAEISLATAATVNTLKPFGPGNPQPLFMTDQVEVLQVNTVGADNQHLKILAGDRRSPLSVIGFGLGTRISELARGEMVSLAYHIGINDYQGTKRLQLELKDFKRAHENGFSY